MSTQSRYGNTNVNREYLTTPVTIPIDYTSDLSGSFTTFSMVDKNYVDNQISIITGSDIDQINGTNGISGGGTSGVITLLLGGTLSQNTTINASTFDFIIGDVGTILMTASTFDVEANGFVSIDAGTGSAQFLADDNITLSSNSIDLASTGDINFTFNNGNLTDGSGNGYGLVYTSDYSGTFVTNSLVSKLYVDTLISSSDTLAEILAVGNTSSTDIIMTEGDDIVFKYYGWNNRINTQPLTNHRSINFPDASGTVSLTSDLSGYLPLSGGTMSGDIETSNAIWSTNGGYIDFSGASAVGITNDNNGYSNEGFYMSPGYSSQFINGYNSEMAIKSDELSELFYYYDTSVTFGVGANLGLLVNPDFALGLGTLYTESKSSNFLISTSNGSVDGSASNSGILGGYLNSISNLAPRSVILGGSNITATKADTAYTQHLEVKGDAIIDGNLTISGTQTIINTENLYVEDNIITLNATFSGTPILDSGIEVNRGTGTWSKLFWDETQDYWVAGLSGSETPLLVNATNGLSISGNSIELGGTLSQYTEVQLDSNYFLFNRNSTGAFGVYSSTDRYTYLIDSDFNSNILLGESSDTETAELRFRRKVVSGFVGPGGRFIPNGEVLGDIIWTGNNGSTGATESAVIRATVNGSNGTDAELNFLTKSGSNLRQHMVITKDGNVGIGTASADETLDLFGSFRLKDGTESEGYILKSDNSGTTTWVAPSSLGIPTKYTEFGLSLTANTPSTITHNLGTQSIICQAWDTSTGETLNVVFKNRATNSVDILSTYNVTVDVIIQG